MLLSSTRRLSKCCRPWSRSVCSRWLSTESATADFRSDTVTVPDAAMREAMAHAAVGDDVYGEDPTVNELERFVADLMGKEAALFVTSGTMGNLLTIGAVCARGDEVLTADKSHVEMHEAGGASVLLGVKITSIPTVNAGEILPHQVENAVRRGDSHWAPTRMLCIENTNVEGGGSVFSLEHMSGTIHVFFVVA